MQDLEKLSKAEKAVAELCSHCSFCTPECYIFKAMDALKNVRYDWESYAAQMEAMEDYPQEEA